MVGLVMEPTPLPVQPQSRGASKYENSSIRDVGWSVLGIGRINISSRFLRALSLAQQTHHILSDIHTNGTAQGMMIERDTTLLVYIRNIAGVVGGMPNISTATVARDILHHVGIR